VGRIAVLTAATLAYRQLGGRSDGDQGLSESTRRPSARKCDALLPWPGAKRRKDTAPHFETAQDLAAHGYDWQSATPSADMDRY